MHNNPRLLFPSYFHCCYCGPRYSCSSHLLIPMLTTHNGFPILKVCSYSCRGLKSGSDYVKSVLQACNICLIQEHRIPQFLMTFPLLVWTPDLSVGHPSGGCAILYHKTLFPTIHRIFTVSQHFSAISLTLYNFNNSVFVTLCLSAH